MSDFPHVQCAFINAIREEGTKKEACDFLQQQWNETCWLRKQIDLPATDAQIKANPKVQAMRRVLEIVADGDNKDYTDNCNLARAALAELDAPMRCAECDCKNGGADCNWIATP